MKANYFVCQQIREYENVIKNAFKIIKICKRKSDKVMFKREAQIAQKNIKQLKREYALQ